MNHLTDERWADLIVTRAEHPDLAAGSARLLGEGFDNSVWAVEETWADFAWMLTYGIAGVCAGELARREVRHLQRQVDDLLPHAVGDAVPDALWHGRLVL